MKRMQEQLRIFSPLGIRFWDPVADRPAHNALNVCAYPADQPWAVRRAFRTTSGLYAFQGLPGLRSIEHPIAGTPTVPPRSFVIEVDDSSGHYFPVSFTVDLPLGGRGVFPLPDPGSPPDDGPAGFLLFASAGRKETAEHALCYATIEDEDGTAAAYAVIELTTDDGALWYGIANESGSVALALPYPALTTSLSGSPPSGDSDLDDESWPVTIGVLYAPKSVALSANRSFPDLSSLFNQPPVDIIGPGGSAAPEFGAELRLGRPTVLTTPGRSSLVVRRPT
jgi:hypothetical protein